MYVTVQRKIQSQQAWITLVEGIEVGETTYQSPPGMPLAGW